MSKEDPFHILRIIPKQYDLPDENIEFHIEQIKEIDHKINKPKPVCYEYERNFRFTNSTKLFSLGYRTNNFNRELDTNRGFYSKCFSNYEEADISSLHALRLELENEIDKLFELFLLECSSIELQIITHLYNQIREHEIEINNDKEFNRLARHTEDVLNQLYNRELSDLYRMYSLQSTPYGMSKESLLYKFADTVFNELNTIDKDIISRASIFAIKYALVQEATHDKLTDNDKNREVVKSLRDGKIRKMLSSKTGKLDYMEEVRNRGNINSYEEALEKVNEESLRLLDEKAYKNVDSYYATKSAHHSNINN